jgi:L,D-transpeptidase catalytic domain
MQRFQFTAITVAVTLCFLFVTPESRAQAHTKGSPVAPLTPTLKPGHYVWHPEVSPAGPVVVLVSLPDQILYVYRNGVRIGRSTVSTGKPGKRTPTGVFTVLQKKVRHESSIYKGAQMPHIAEAHLGWHRASRRVSAGLSCISGLRANAGGFCGKTLLRDRHRDHSHNRRQQVRSEPYRPARLAVFRKDRNVGSGRLRVDAGKSAERAGLDHREHPGSQGLHLPERR